MAMMKYFLILWLLILGFISIRSGSVTENVPAQQDCKKCHNDITGFSNMHPALEDGCTTCHEPEGDDHPEKGGFKLVENVPALCFVCHEEYHKKNVHTPASEGECLSCHSPHGSNYEALLTVKKEDLCVVCHDMGETKKQKPHFEDFNGACTDCHNSHQSDNASLLAEPMPDVCFQCHEDESNGGGQVSIHYPYTEESCTTCHKPHGSEIKGMLTEKTPDLCYMCHEKGESAHPHDPVEKGKCTECHSPHASGEQTLLKQSSKELCLSCHSKTYRTDSTVIKNIGQQLLKNKFVHGAIEMDGCVTCHSGHGTQFAELLKSKYPDTYYAEGVAENYDLCFQCHDSAILQKDPSLSDTGFRNGNTNLHYLHLKGKKGRSCSLCHDVHAGKNSHLIRKKVPFGDWSMNMNFKSTDNGGSCMPGCHGEVYYDRTLKEKKPE